MGSDFFADCRERARKVLYPDDLNRFLDVLTKENVMEEIKRHGIFSLSYRLMVNDTPRYMQMRAAIVDEKEG